MERGEKGKGLQAGPAQEKPRESEEAEAGDPGALAIPTLGGGGCEDCPSCSHLQRSGCGGGVPHSSWEAPVMSFSFLRVLSRTNWPIFRCSGPLG